MFATKVDGPWIQIDVNLLASSLILDLNMSRIVLHDEVYVYASNSSSQSPSRQAIVTLDDGDAYGDAHGDDDDAHGDDDVEE